MKRFILSILFFYFIQFVLAQAPMNDDCDNAIFLGTVPISSNGTIYANTGATASCPPMTAIPVCFMDSLAARDVWFKFNTDSSHKDYRIIIEGIGIKQLTNPQVAVYSGICSNLNLVGCDSKENGSHHIRLDIENLIPNATYFIRVCDWKVTEIEQDGTFQINVMPSPTTYLINQVGSKEQTGFLYDSGGTIGKYQSSEKQLFSICPQDLVGCVELTLDYFNIDNHGDKLVFYDGATIKAPILDSIVGDNSLALTTGGVKYKINSSGNCLSVLFQSNANKEYEGFKGHWESWKNCIESQKLWIEELSPYSLGSMDQDGYDNKASISVENCPQQHIGIFRASDDSELNMTKGVIISTTNVTDWLYEQTTPNSNLLTTGIFDLDTLFAPVGGKKTQDGCSIKFSYCRTKKNDNQFILKYMFLSEEYNTDIDTTENDVFALFNVLGSFSNKYTLPLSLLPNNELLSINSVNKHKNWQNYLFNSLENIKKNVGGIVGYLGEDSYNLVSNQNGYKGTSYNFRAAIADRGHRNTHSALLVYPVREPQNAKIGVRTFSNTNKNWTLGHHYMSECSNKDTIFLKFYLDKPQKTPYPFTTEYDNISLSSPAIKDKDFLTNLPSTVVFPPNVTELIYYFVPIKDTLQEGIEFVNILVKSSENFNAGCPIGEQFVIADDFYTHNFINEPSIIYCNNSQLEIKADHAETYQWSPASLFDNPTSPNPTLKPITKSQWLYVTGTNGNCSATDSVFVALIDPKATLQSDKKGLCQGDSVRLYLPNALPQGEIKWTTEKGYILSRDSVLTLHPTKSQFYFATIATEGCKVKDSIRIVVDSLSIPQIINDTTLCKGQSIQLSKQSNVSSMSYQWQPTAQLNNATQLNATAQLQKAIHYTLLAQSKNGYCSTKDSVRLSLYPVGVAILPSDTVKICPQDSVTLRASGLLGTQLSLSWSSTLPSVQGDKDKLFLAELNQNAVIYLKLTTKEQCIAYDTMYLQLKPESECNQEAILIPTVFLPDGTSEDNKEFGISLPENIGVYSLTIYNRWGNIVYQTTEGKPWKGNNPDGSLALSDVYLYVIEVPSNKGKPSVIKKGDVTLLR
jgi:hypothetical protein